MTKPYRINFTHIIAKFFPMKRGKEEEKRKERGENRLRNEYVNNNCALIHVRER